LSVLFNVKSIVSVLIRSVEGNNFLGLFRAHIGDGKRLYVGLGLGEVQLVGDHGHRGGEAEVG
jgi:hypothetical protein